MFFQRWWFVGSWHWLLIFSNTPHCHTFRAHETQRKKKNNFQQQSHRCTGARNSGRVASTFSRCARKAVFVAFITIIKIAPTVRIWSSFETPGSWWNFQRMASAQLLLITVAGWRRAGRAQPAFVVYLLRYFFVLLDQIKFSRYWSSVAECSEWVGWCFRSSFASSDRAFSSCGLFTDFSGSDGLCQNRRGRRLGSGCRRFQTCAIESVRPGIVGAVFCFSVISLALCSRSFAMQKLQSGRTVNLFRRICFGRNRR